MKTKTYKKKTLNYFTGSHSSGANTASPGERGNFLTLPLCPPTNFNFFSLELFQLSG